MSTHESYRRLRSFDELYIPFPQFLTAKNTIETCLNDFRETGITNHMLVTGEAGSGKTSLCRWLSQQHPRKVLKDRNVMGVLITSIPPSATISGFASAMLSALGDPFPERGTVTSRSQRVITLCRQCRVEMLLFDEAQHLHDRGNTKTHYMVGDWLKYLIDDLNVPTVLLGLPRTENILLINDQLRRRFSKRCSLALGQDKAANIAAESLQIFLSLASQIDIPVQYAPFSAQELGERLYFASDGRVAYIKKLLVASLRQSFERKIDVIDIALLEQVFTTEIWWDALGPLNPFNENFEFRRLDRGGEPFQAASNQVVRKSK